MLKDLRSLLYYDKYYKNEVKQISSQKQLKIASIKKEDMKNRKDTKDLTDCLSNFGENLKGEYAFLDLIITDRLLFNFEDVLKFQHIEKLVIKYNDIVDITKINELENLIDCNISDNAIKVIPEMLNENLLYLDLSNNNLESFIDLSSLENLKKLNLANNKLCQVPNSEVNKSLRELDLSGNNIKDLSSLGQFDNLKILKLKNCQIKSLKGIKDLSKLTHLDISENSIKSLEPLTCLTYLKTLDISGNNITQIFEFKHIKHLSTLISIDVRGNPVTKTKFYNQIILHDMPYLLEMDGKCLTEKEFVETEVFFGADLKDKKEIAEKYLGKGNFEDNRLVHSTMKEFKEIITEPPKLYKADFF